MPTSNQLHVFFVRADNADGENLDLLVVALDKAHAQRLWVTSFEDAGEPGDIEWVGLVPGVTPQVGAGPLEWWQII